ncbi:MAG TPA: hypothetical protein VFI24_04320 [Pyrinomonadaceae bacterium]|nr:hypothetical protein [Pyrinomonadaceae bacterium]
MISRQARGLVCCLALMIFTGAIAQVASIAHGEARAQLDQDPPEVSLILTSEGFNPVEVRPPAHRFLLSIDNRSGVSELVFRLNRADGTQVKELHVSGAAGDWNETLDLTAGTYTLSEPNHSNWLCTIIIQ